MKKFTCFQTCSKCFDKRVCRFSCCIEIEGIDCESCDHKAKLLSCPSERREKPCLCVTMVPGVMTQEYEETCIHKYIVLILRTKPISKTGIHYLFLSFRRDPGRSVAAASDGSPPRQACSIDRCKFPVQQDRTGHWRHQRFHFCRVQIQSKVQKLRAFAMWYKSEILLGSPRSPVCN